jgi:hypothetical protein
MRREKTLAGQKEGNQDGFEEADVEGELRSEIG